MNTQPSALSRTQLLAAVTDVLTLGGYHQGPVTVDQADFRLFEDALGIVGLAVYDTWPQLLDSWHLAQGWLVDAIAENLNTREPKAWEGYLVLMTPGLHSPADELVVSDLRNNTNRVRKLVATGNELSDLGTVRDVLLPLLPIDLQGVEAVQGGVLDMLEEVLMSNGISEAVAQTVVEAFSQNESVVESLHARRVGR